MFAMKVKTIGQTIAIESSVKALTPVQAAAIAKKDDTTVEGVTEARSFLREYVALQYASDAIDADLTARAYAVLEPMKTVEEFEFARKQFGEFYVLEYKARFTGKTEADATQARDMAWSRFVKRAMSKGFVSPKKAAAAAKKTGKPAAPKKPDGRAVGNNKGKGKAQAKIEVAKVETVSQANSAIIAQVAKSDPDYAAAMTWVNQSGANKAAFIAWYKSQATAQLDGKVLKIA